jgi:hypothetical protein
LESDEVVFGPEGTKDVSIDQDGVKPGAMEVTADGYAFSGGPINGYSLTLSSPAGSAAVFRNEFYFSSGITLNSGNSLVFDYSSSGAWFGFSGLGSSLPIPKLAVIGGIRPASIDPGNYAADLRGAGLSWLVPPTAENGDVFLTVSGRTRINGATSFTLAYASGRPDIAAGEGFVLIESQTLEAAGFQPLTAIAAGGDKFLVELDPDDPDRLVAFLTDDAPSGTDGAPVPDDSYLEPPVPVPDDTSSEPDDIPPLPDDSPLGPAAPRLKAYPEARIASLAFTGQGQDLITAKGLPSALTATAGPGRVRSAFGGLIAGRSLYSAGSRADVSGLSLLAGLGYGSDFSSGRLTLGAFVEGGRGSYDSRNSFPNSARVHGDGDTSYFGGGILGRYDFLSGSLSGLYFDASARLGREETDFRTADIQYDGAGAAFKTSGRYCGLHGGLGWLRPVSGPDGQLSLDLSAKLLWTGQAGDTANVSADRVRFSEADSLRLRAGVRLLYSAGERTAPYFGAYYEREFDGQVRTEVNGRPIGSPSLKGHSGIFELGLAVKPAPAKPWSIDLGVQGYAGKREGFSGSVSVRLEF